MRVDLYRITPFPENLIAMGYGVCTNKDPKPIKLENIKKWIKQGHHSPIEHASATFLITGISRTCLAQLTRHRLASYSVLSQRYVEQTSATDCVVPDTIKENEKAKGIFEDANRGAYIAYTMLRNIGIPREDARFLLPEGTTTKLLMTTNFREWRTIIKLRCTKYAQWEIREMCTRILRILNEQAPNVFGDLAERFLNEL